MSELFGRERSVIIKHLRNVFAEGELDEESNVQNLHILPQTGKPIRSSTIISKSSSPPRITRSQCTTTFVSVTCVMVGESSTEAYRIHVWIRQVNPMI